MEMMILNKLMIMEANNKFIHKFKEMIDFRIV